MSIAESNIAMAPRRFFEQEPTDGPRDLLDRPWIRVAIALIGTFSAVILGLLLTGNLGSVYESIYMTCCWDEPWTHVMRRAPWAYVGLFVVPTVGLARWLPLRVGTRAIVVYSTFLVGFLGGHVLW